MYLGVPDFSETTDEWELSMPLLFPITMNIISECTSGTARSLTA